MANGDFNDFVRTLDKSTANFDMEAEKLIGRTALKLLKRAKLKTPVDTGQLHNSWHINMPSKLVREVYNNCEYALNIEFGHRTRQGMGSSKRYRPKNGGIKRIKGVYMLIRSVEEVEKDLDADLRIFLENLWD